MAKFSQTFLQGLLQPTYQQGLFDVARSVGQAPALMRQQEQRQQREKGMMGGMLAAQQAAAEGRFDPETMKSFMGSMQGLGVPAQDIMQTLPTLQQANQASVVNNKQNQLVGLQQQLNEQAQILLESDDRSRKEAANYQIDSIEEQMVNIGKETRGIDAGTFVGVGDKTRPGVTKAQLNQIEKDGQRRGAGGGGGGGGGGNRCTKKSGTRTTSYFYFRTIRLWFGRLERTSCKIRKGGVS